MHKCIAETGRRQSSAMRVARWSVVRAPENTTSSSSSSNRRERRMRQGDSSINWPSRKHRSARRREILKPKKKSQHRGEQRECDAINHEFICVKTVRVHSRNNTAIRRCLNDESCKFYVTRPCDPIMCYYDCSLGYTINQGRRCVGSLGEMFSLKDTANHAS